MTLSLSDSVASPFPLFRLQSINLLHNYCIGILTLNTVSPFVTVLNPPEKLVLRIEAGGRFLHIDWYKNGDSLVNLNFNLRFRDPRVLYSHNQIYSVGNTSMSDAGVYRARVSNNNDQLSTVFAVLGPCK